MMKLFKSKGLEKEGVKAEICSNRVQATCVSSVCFNFHMIGANEKTRHCMMVIL